MTLPGHIGQPVNLPLELWGGVECTVNRVGDVYFDQLELSGHSHRFSDLDTIAALGIKTLRYPVLWERVAPHAPTQMDWAWTDERLNGLRERGIKPIAGLLHHGSGPAYTSLVDPDFPQLLAEYAGAVAQRYPWITAYTPVNEPVTTARFSGLYGYWYPHGTDERSFATIVVNECKATVLAMAAIRRVNPAAQLILTEDYGHTFATPLLAYQADFENERRRLSFDLLCGKLTPDRQMWQYLVNRGGISPDQLVWFLANPCPPDVMGINYYLTSDRYLDEDLSVYPEHTHGGNNRHAYADVESVRTPQGIAGHTALLTDLWQRYGLPMAITEAHLGGTREEQLRWLNQTWLAANAAKTSGVDVRAVTVWSLLGAYNWHCLVTRDEGCYEPGTFDLRGPDPRPTVLADWCQAITQRQTLGHLSDYAPTPTVQQRPSQSSLLQHPLLQQPGWWQRPEACLYPGEMPPLLLLASVQKNLNTSPVLIVGATGTLGQAFARVCGQRGILWRLTNRQDLDITQPLAIDRVLEAIKPWAVINAAGYVRVDDAETDEDRCHRENVLGPGLLAEACAKRHIPLVVFSSDLVFDGQLTRAYVESDCPAPINAYGRSKLLMEASVAQVMPAALIIRTSAFFSPWDDYNFLTVTLRRLLNKQTCLLANDVMVSPTYLPDLVNATLDLLVDQETGIWHLSNASGISWLDFARLTCEMAGVPPANRLKGCATSQLGLAAQRPINGVLSSNRGNLLPSLTAAIQRYVSDCDWLNHALKPDKLAVLT